MKLLQTLQNFYEQTLEKYAPWDDSVQIQKLKEHEDGTEEVRLRFYTYLNEYGIVAKEGPDSNYLGSFVTARKAKAGEDHKRGRDLPDGSMSVDTWMNIICAILSYEVGPLYKRPKPVHGIPAGCGDDKEKNCHTQIGYR